MNKQNRAQIAHLTRLSTIAALTGLALVTATTLSGARTADAADRPGTPNNVTAIVQGAASGRAPSIRVRWNNTATEDVCFEFNTTMNASPADLGAGCVDRCVHLLHAEIGAGPLPESGRGK